VTNNQERTITMKIELAGPIANGIASRIVEQIESASPEETLLITIDSEGGSVFDGFRIYEALRSHKGSTIAHCKTAFSIASFIATACDEIHISEYGMMMIHKPMLQYEGVGHAEDFQSNADLLNELQSKMIRAYRRKLRMSEPELISRLNGADWFVDADQAIQLGLADKIIPSSTRIQVSAELRQLAHSNDTPEDLRKLWQAEVLYHINAGLRPSAALIAAHRSNPQLQRRLVAAFNQKKM
jgi:ATP-dependent protease ClpP protease subunit